MVMPSCMNFIDGIPFNIDEKQVESSRTWRHCTFLYKSTERYRGDKLCKNNFVDTMIIVVEIRIRYKNLRGIDTKMVPNSENE